MARYPEDLLIAAAHYYYIEGHTQGEVAARLNVPRVMVTRMLKRAREQGLVEITVKKPLPQLYKLSVELEQRYHLRVARVVRNGANGEETMDALGRSGAELLATLVHPDCRIGVAWSKTVSAILPHVKALPFESSRCTINDLAGTYLAPNVPFSVSWPLAQKLNTRIESIPLPVIVQNDEAKKAMLKEEMISRALRNAPKVDFAFLGLGEMSENSSLAQTGYITKQHLAELAGKHAVGEVLMRYYDVHGEHIETSFDSMIVAPSWREIRGIPFVIAMAAGANKIDAIRGALDGNIIQGLITDRETAETLLGVN